MTTKLEQLEAECKAASAHYREQTALYWEGKTTRFELRCASRAVDKLQAKRNREQTKQHNANAPREAFRAMQSTGRCLEGERDHGRLYHAVSDHGALCGYTPGRLTGGWSQHIEKLSAVDCPRCVKALAKKPEREPLAA